MLVCFGMVMIIVMLMADCCQVHKYGGQQGEYQRLNDTDEKLQDEERPRQNGHQEAHDEEHNRPGEDIAQKTEAEREYLGEVTDELQQSDRHINAA